MKYNRIFAGLCAVFLIGSAGAMACLEAASVSGSDKIDIGDIQLPTNPDGSLKLPTADDYYDFTLKADGTYEISFFKYKVSEGTAFVPQNISLTLPSSYNGKPVTSIGDSAFQTNNADIIGSIVIPSSITSIGNAAFWMCNFTSCTIPESVTHIGSQAFDDTPWLESMRAKNPLVVVNHILIDGKTASGDVVIPKGVADIAGFAFYKNGSMKSVVLPGTLKRIGSAAFEYCSSLTELKIPNSVTEIGEWAFAFCEGLTGTVTIPGNVREIEKYVFHDCRNITGVVIQNGVTAIRDSAFRICLSLEQISIPDSVTSIGDFAFTETHKLGAIDIPSSVSYIGRECFLYSFTRSVTIRNPRCEIYDDATTFPSGVTLYGHSSSLVQSYAEKYDRNFVPLDGTFTLGDVNNDKSVDATDASLILIAAARIGAGSGSGLTEMQELAANVNGKDGIDATDASLILQYAAASGAGLQQTLEEFLEN